MKPAKFGRVGRDDWRWCCHKCTDENGNDLPLKRKMWVCPSCGIEHETPKWAKGQTQHQGGAR